MPAIKDKSTQMGIDLKMLFMCQMGSLHMSISRSFSTGALSKLYWHNKDLIFCLFSWIFGKF